MIGARARSTAVAALVAATAVLAAGCGGGSHEERPRAAAAPSVTASASASDEAPAKSGGKPSAPADSSKPAHRKPEGKDRAENEPTVPKSELTPATGTFTAKQKEYLLGRVPKGTDPAAVLQAGQETCSRIKSTAGLDREAAVSALKSGEIRNAQPAVEHLCPTFRPLLRDAGLTD